MKNKIVCLFAGLIVLLSGCSSDYADVVKERNRQSVNNPEIVAVMPDGRTLHRIKIISADTYNHYIYYFGTNDTNTISINSIAGKGNATIVIDGKNFELVPVKK